MGAQPRARTSAPANELTRETAFRTSLYEPTIRVQGVNDAATEEFKESAERVADLQRS